jgi:hypothetical protein
MQSRNPQTTKPLVSFISLGRAIFGAAVVCAPITTCSIFGITITPTGAMLAEMFGAREVALGILLYTAKNRLIASTPSEVKNSTKEVKRLLWAGIGVDTFDFICFTGVLLAGTVDKIGFAMLAGPAVGLVGIQLLILRLMGDGDEKVENGNKL